MQVLSILLVLHRRTGELQSIEAQFPVPRRAGSFVLASNTLCLRFEAPDIEQIRGHESRVPRPHDCKDPTLWF